jgi:hypothetical protein
MIAPRSISARDIAALQDACTRRWHQAEGLVVSEENPWLRTVAEQHAANFELWHTEDQARLPNATDAQITAVKRAIDRINQRRNDLAESCDLLLLQALAAQNLPAGNAPLHSESPGLMIDRLSILSLKIFHTAEQIERTDAPAGHVERNRERLAILKEQQGDLIGAFDRVWAAVLAGTLRFKLYRQLKMYNDPDLNPAIYRANRLKTKNTIRGGSHEP